MGAPGSDQIAAQIVARALSRFEPRERSALMRAFLRHTAAALVVIYSDPEKAAEDLYRLADEVVGRGHAV